jgi:hypothetical protein
MKEKESNGLEAKVAALLAIAVDQYLRETGVAKPRPRSIDRMLVDAGLSVRDVAGVLGKTEQAVYLVLQGDQKKGKSVRPKSKSSVTIQDRIAGNEEKAPEAQGGV